MNNNFPSLTLALLILATIMPYNAIAQTRLGLHVTQEELNIWKQRAQNGPYKSTGDVRTNSPGDWTRIVNNKNSFLSNPSAQRWAGQTVNSCAQPWAPEPGQGTGYLIVDAGFYYLVADTAADRESVRVAVRNELLAQTATAGTDFSNRTRWCQNSPYGPVTDEGTTISNWLTRLLFAYDYIRPSLTATERSTIDTWFLNAGTYLAQIMDRWLTSSKFPGRNSDNYSNPTDVGVGGADFFKTHYGGYQSDGWHRIMVKSWRRTDSSQRIDRNHAQQLLILKTRASVIAKSGSSTPYSRMGQSAKRTEA